VQAREVRAIFFGSGGKSEGVVADDGPAQVYISEEGEAIWKFGAEPDAGTARTRVDQPISQRGHFQPDIEGLGLYYTSDGTGYLIVSSQSNNS
jgi:3-phytase